MQTVWILTVMLLFSSTSFAGVDFSMMGTQKVANYDLPFFESADEAIRWAHGMKWIEPLRRILKHKIELMRLETARLDMYKQEDIKKATFLMGEREYYLLALGIMEEYKKKGVEGKIENVGATLVASSVPVKR